MTYAARQARLRVAEEVERAVGRFGSDEDLWPIRVPREPLSLDDLVRRALPDDHARFDVATLRARTLLHLMWEDDSAWELWVMTLPSGLKVFCDSGADEHRVLATGGRHAGAETDRLFLERLAESGGGRFGIEMAGGAPTVVRAGGIERGRLVDFFVHLFEVTRTERSVRQQLDRAGIAVPPAAGGTDFRHLVASWLDLAASNGGARGGPADGQGPSPCISERQGEER